MEEFSKDFEKANEYFSKSLVNRPFDISLKISMKYN